MNLSIDSTYILHHIFDDSWAFMLNEKECKIGRLNSFEVKHETTQTFTFTKSVLWNLERIQQAINNIEPVLLVGETGTGKTTIV